MEIKDRIDIFTVLDDLRTAEYGVPTKILPNTFLVKFPKHIHRFGNGYILKHINRKDVLLIDVTREETKPAVAKLLEQGYTISGILLTHKGSATQAYAELDILSKDAGGAPIFIHPLDNGTQAAATKDITAKHKVFDDFTMTIFDFPGHTAGSVVIYTEINNGMLFTGDSAVGSNYENDDYYFERPIIDNHTIDYGLAESWKAFDKYFEQILPLHGKPQFELSEGQQKDILLRLSKDEPTKKL